MKVSRRGLLASAMAVPAAAGLANWQWKHGHGTVLLFDAEMPEGRAFDSDLALHASDHLPLVAEARLIA